MGIGYYGNRQIAYVREDSHKMAQTFWEIQIVKTMMTLLSIIAFEIFMMFYTRQPEYMIAQSIKTPIPHVVQAGQWTSSPSGFPISILTGKMAADQVAKKLKR